MDIQDTARKKGYWGTPLDKMDAFAFSNATSLYLNPSLNPLPGIEVTPTTDSRTPPTVPVASRLVRVKVLL